MKKLLDFIDNISEWTGRICSFVIIVMTIVVVTEVIRRYIFNSPTIWSFEVTIMLYSFHFMVVAAYTLLHEGHVAIDILYEKLRPRGRTILDVVGYVIFFFPFLLVVLFSGIRFAATSWAMHETSWSVFGPPVYPIKTVIPVTAFLLILQGFSIFVRKLYAARKGRKI